MNGIYGTVKPADVDPAKDIDIFYSYKPNANDMGSDYDTFTKIDSNFLTKSRVNVQSGTEILDGMYNLKIPSDIFGKKGIYTIYIKPKERESIISDVSILMSYPDVRGLVFQKENLDGLDDLTGYRVEFLDDNGKKTGESRIITSCGHCSPRNASTKDKYEDSIRYVYTDTSSNSLFCTVSPSLAPSFRPDKKVYIGTAGSRVKLVNTKFNPVMLELEMVEHDIETLSTSLEGTQVRDLENGKIVTFNDNDDIYSVHEYFTLKDSLAEPIYDVKIKKDTFNEDSADYKDIIKK